jgi:hypothetical protein
MSDAQSPSAGMDAYRGGSGSPLVLLHGALGTWRVWLPVIERFERAHSVFAPTLSGHDGAARRPDGRPASIGSLADAIERQFDDAGIAGANSALKRLGALPQLLEVGVAGKTAGWHKGLLSPSPESAITGRKGEPTTNTNTPNFLQAGFALSADWQRPARRPIISVVQQRE